MFQPETEDMLPRMAPKPSVDVPSGASEGIIRPQVPEVSILFGQETNLPQGTISTANQQQLQSNNQQTYAAWKKQMLPKVTYPPAANMADIHQLPENNHNMIIQDYNSQGNNLYPLRSTTAPPLNMGANPNNFGGIGNTLTYHRSLESCNSNMVYQQMQHLPTLSPQSPLPTLKPIVMQSSNTNPRDVLTICAGTQTDASFDSPNNYLKNLQFVPWSNLASKNDVDDVRQVLEEMKHEQQRIVKMLETLLFNTHNQMAVRPQSRDIGVQADCVENVSQEPQGCLQQSVPKNKFLQHLKPSNILHTPKGKPMAQSTAYQPNSPQPQCLQQNIPELALGPTHQQVSNKPAPAMSKSASDTSLAMNELALKYLPNEKLAELLQELNMDCPGTNRQSVTNEPITPVRGNMNKFEKGPSDISNASYKYLKKYRLLPEDHDVEGNRNFVGGNEGKAENVNVTENQMSPYNSPQYHNIRNTPINQRQTPTNNISPFAEHLPMSPLARVSPPPLQTIVQQHNVNLENIKHQPKFL